MISTHVPATADPWPELSIVIPVHDEADAIASLVDEVVEALRRRTTFEVIVVDDASTDGTAAVLASLKARVPELRVLRHSRNAGQSMAIRSGVLAARSEWIATLDGDGQNDPADIPRMLDQRDALPAFVRLVAGVRTRRRDGVAKRWASKIANGVRGWLLDDLTPDSGCGLKLFTRSVFIELPYFDHMHRFLPALVRRTGAEVMHVPVNHRPRVAGRSKYGTLDRLWVGISDLRGVMWLQKRYRGTRVTES
ncbi:glycosyltransferase family 2 protein [Dokdonella sp. MW10]|uniref:glycosyltransferase family 2 protein n=1 Tax=Dokdonella sp. MW10 TaxID=2992926 RepID=UPI003F815DB6